MDTLAGADARSASGSGFDVDVGGTLALTQAAAPHLRGGTVVNLIAARGGTSPGAAHLSVSPSQAALTALTRCLATILAAGRRRRPRAA